MVTVQDDGTGTAGTILTIEQSEIFQIQGIASIGTNISDIVYGAGWNGETTTAPSQNAVYDKMEDAKTIVGSLIAWPTNAAPSGYLECDGSAISRSTYAALFAVISDDYGDGDGSTTFNLPDYQGQFLRGYDNSAGVDPDAGSRTNRGDGTTGDNVGTKQTDGLKAHNHQVTGKRNPSGTAGGNFSMRDSGINDTQSVDNKGGNETRPTNVNVMYCIKY